MNFCRFTELQKNFVSFAQPQYTKKDGQTARPSLQKSRQTIPELPSSPEPIGTVHQLVCDGVKRPPWRTISTHQPNHNCKIQHKCNAQQYHQKFFHTLFSFCLMIPSLFCPHYTDWAGRYGCPSYTSHKKETRHSHFECTVFLLSAFAALLLHRSQSFISVSSRICHLYL